MSACLPPLEGCDAILNAPEVCAGAQGCTWSGTNCVGDDDDVAVGGEGCGILATEIACVTDSNCVWAAATMVDPK